MLKRTHQAIAIICLKRKPLLLVEIGWRKPGSHVEIPVVTRDREGLAHLRPQTHHGVEAVGIGLAEFAGILWVVALSEEFLFRGLLQQWIGQWTGSSWGALILASIIFGSAHLGFHGPFPNWRFAFVAASFGLCCGLAWRESRTIQASMITHALGATLYRVFFQ